MTLWNIHQTIPKRYILALLAFCVLTVGNSLRSALSLAIIPMVKPPVHQLSDHSSLLHSTSFNWSTKTQGYILSSVFYGYTITQIPAGLLATKIGGKLLFGFGVGFAGFLSLFTLISARMGPTALIILRAFEGIGLGSLLPSLYSIWSKWAPKGDKAILTTFTYSGYSVGSCLILLFGGLIAAYWSWEWIFYLSGSSAIICSILWLYFTTESPSVHPTITSEEREYIESNLDQSVIRNYSIPWKSILTSLPVWAMTAVNFSTGWVYFLMFTELPIFLTHVLDFNIQETGGLASLPWLLFAIVMSAGGFLQDKSIKHHSTSYIRKLILGIPLIIISLAFLFIILLNSNSRVLIIINIIIILGCCGLSYSVVAVNPLDIGAQYAGVLMGLSNFFGSMPGIIVPILTAYLAPHTNLKQEWNIIFIISILVCVFSLIFYILYGSGEMQPWVENNLDEYQSVLNKTMSSAGNNTDDITNRFRAELKNENLNTK